MRLRRFSVMFALVSFALFLGLAAGCGGGGDSSGQNGGDTAGNTAQQQQQQAAGEQTVSGGSTGAASGDRPRVKIALGTIEAIDPEARTLELAPVEGEPLTFKLVPEARVAVDAQQAEAADLRAGQQAQVRYVTRNEGNRARSVRAFSDGG